MDERSLFAVPRAPRGVTAEDRAASEAAYDQLVERLAQEDRDAEAAWPHKPCPDYCHVCPGMLHEMPPERERWEAVLPRCWGVTVYDGPDWKDRCTCDRPEHRRRHDKAMKRAEGCAAAGRESEARRWRYAARDCLSGYPLPRKV